MKASAWSPVAPALSSPAPVVLPWSQVLVHVLWLPAVVGLPWFVPDLIARQLGLVDLPVLARAIAALAQALAWGFPAAWGASVALAWTARQRAAAPAAWGWAAAFPLAWLILEVATTGLIVACVLLSQDINRVLL